MYALILQQGQIYAFPVRAHPASQLLSAPLTHSTTMTGLEKPHGCGHGHDLNFWPKKLIIVSGRKGKGKERGR